MENPKYNSLQLVLILDIYPTVLSAMDGLAPCKDKRNATIDVSVYKALICFQRKWPLIGLLGAFPKDFTKGDSGGEIAFHKALSSLKLCFGWLRFNWLQVLNYNHNQQESNTSIALNESPCFSKCLQPQKNGTRWGRV